MEFDRYAESYRSEVDQAAGVSVEGLAGEKARLILDVLSRTLGNPDRLRALDIGCGIGLIEQELERNVADLWATDMSEKSIEYAKARAPATRFIHSDGDKLPFDSGSFDAVFTSCVIHHVPPAARAKFIEEMLRVLRSGGAAIIIEHNPINPVTRYIVSRCAFDADAVLLTCRESISLLAQGGAAVAGRRYIGFSPVRHVLVERMERALGWLPAGAQYCVWGVKT
jgi:ubiquinone/menaquinone biosynthesis C-methylase UbiE